MPIETYDWSTSYVDEQAGTTTTFTGASGQSVDVTVSQPDPNGYYRNNRDGFETNTTMGGFSGGYFDQGVNFSSNTQTLTTTIDFSNNTDSGSNSVTDPSFTIYDVDATSSGSFQDQVTVRAWDANGNELTVTLTATNSSVVSVSGNTATAIPGAGSGGGGSVNANQTDGNVQVSISGQVSRIEITYGNGSSANSNPSNQAIGFGDLSFDLTEPVVCFARGTRLLGPGGAVPVEAIRAGDLLVTRDNGPRPVRWVGSRKVAGRGRNAPIRFAPGAIGNDRPLLLSPPHRVMVSGWKVQLMFGCDEALVPAKSLVDGRMVRAVPMDRVEYFHVAFDAHELVLAEGAVCESLLPGSEAMRALDGPARGALVAGIPGPGGGSVAGMPAARPLLRNAEGRLLRPEAA